MSDELAFKAPVRLATTATITLSGEQTIDGAATSEDRVLVKNQSADAENGIYVSSSGPWERTSDFDGPLDFTSGTMVRVTEGAVNAGTVWGCTVSDETPDVGISAITWAAFNPSASVSGDLAAIEALTGTGIARRTGADTWTLGTLVANAEMDDMPEATIKGRHTGTGEPEDLSGDEATELLSPFEGDAGDGGVKGLVPAPGIGDAAKFLKGDGSWDDIVVTNAELDDMPAGTIKGRVTGTGEPEDLTGTEATTLLDEMEGATLTVAGTKGLVPAQAAGDASKFLRGDAAWDYPLESMIIAVTDENTAVTAGTNKVTFRMPYAFRLTRARASLTTAQATDGAGDILTVDIKEEGTSVFTTLLTIVNTELSSEDTAVDPAFGNAGPDLADDAQITIDVTQVGDGSAKGLKVALIGRQI